MRERLTGHLRGAAHEVLHQVRLRSRLKRIDRQCPILVFQMGKVGSSTVVRTLQNLPGRAPVLHLHTLNPVEIRKACQRERASFPPYLPSHLVASRLVARKLGNGLFPAKIITLTREPVGRAISFAFEDWRKKARSARQHDGSLDADHMRSVVERMLRGKGGHADPTQWFERELRTVFGFDVFAVPFDFDRGFNVFENEGMSLLVMRMEDLDRSLPAALSAFLGVGSSDVRVMRANEGSASWYADSIERVRRDLHLAPDVIDRILATRYVEHFYSRERASIRERWLA